VSNSNSDVINNEVHRCRVLIVDDADTVRTMLRLMLSSVDEIEIIGEATNGLEAVEMTAALKPDVLILDVSMPVMTGLEAMEEMAKKDQLPAVIIHSGFDTVVHEQALEAGAQSFLTKGSSITEVRDVVREACSTKKGSPCSQKVDA